MKYICDLHIHSKYARACSKNLTPENIAYWAQVKGVDVVGTGDFTHPAWFLELQNKLEEVNNTGLFHLKENFVASERKNIDISGKDIQKTRFMLSSEVSCIYSKTGKTRRVHLLIYSPSFETVRLINDKLSKIGKLGSDGRPIIGFDAKALARLVFDCDERAMVVPAHAWTPWFAIFGSKSGFDSIEECFEELTPKIYAIETGLSSDPLMNFQISGLDKIMLMSNSDAHSGPNLAREANVMELQRLTYDALWGAVKDHDVTKFPSTIEFYPEEGMYHIDGHRLCKVSMEPEETKKNKGVCHVCHRPLTIGVLHRVNDLADRKYGFIPDNAQTYHRIVGLDDIIAEALNVSGRQSKKVKTEYENLVRHGGNELNILLNLEYDSLRQFASENIVEGIRRNREGHLFIEPGFDGQYGKVRVFSEKERLTSAQASML